MSLGRLGFLYYFANYEYNRVRKMRDSSDVKNDL